MLHPVLDGFLDHVIAKAGHGFWQSFDLEEIGCSGPHEEKGVAEGKVERRMRNPESPLTEFRFGALHAVAGHTEAASGDDVGGEACGHFLNKSEVGFYVETKIW